MENNELPEEYLQFYINDVWEIQNLDIIKVN